MKATTAIAALLALPVSPAAHGTLETPNRDLRLKEKKKKNKNRGKASKNSKKDSDSRGGGNDVKYPALYIMTNAEEANSVQMYRRSEEDGTLEYFASFATGGTGGSTAGGPEGSLSGPGNPLGSTRSLTSAGKCLLASNAGSDTVTSFYIDKSGVLVRKGYYDSHGDLPMSIGYKKHGEDGNYLVYVLNAGGEGTLAGFKLQGKTCEMEFIPDSKVSLEQQDTRDPPFSPASPSQVGFVPGAADWLVVNIKGMNGMPGQGTISLYPVNTDGTLGMPEITESNGYVPFAFAFDDGGNLLSVEAAGTEEPPPGETTSAVSSYKIDASDGSLEVIGQESILNRAGCWLQHSHGCVVTTNGGGTLSTLETDGAGDLGLLESTADEVGNPIDLELSGDGMLLYVLGGGRPGIYVYTVEECALSRIQVMTMGVPDLNDTVNGVVGLALYG